EFLYKALHGTQKIGRYWLNIQDLEERSQCQTCAEDESMNHIIVECRHHTRQTIWAIAKETWPHDDNSWPEITLGIILGCGIINIKTTRNTRNTRNHTPRDSPTSDPGATRLAKILISESTHLIWSLRCARVIQGKDYTENEIESIWRRTINKRLAEDIITATQIKRRKENLKQVTDTWGKALEKIHRELPDDWHKRNLTL
ncbi:hypothetical protein BJY52DRAFT_1131727, partial [Lactarius psammicola]